MRRPTSAGTALVMISGLALALTTPIESPAFAADDEVIAEWAFEFSVVQTYADSPTDTEIEAADYSATPGGAMTWSGSYIKHLEQDAGELCGTDVYHEAGTGVGSGLVVQGAGGFSPSAFGLDDSQVWTAVVPAPDGVFPTSYSSANACAAVSGESAKVPRIGPVFLPGSLEDLRALPLGTVLQGSYTATDAYGPGPLVVTYTATKGLESDADADGDGVSDDLDQCPGTPLGTSVDAVGCTVDSDGDGVSDDQDQCAGTPPGTVVDVNGCPIETDADGDGVPDGQDQCAATPLGAVVDASGCSIDSDFDGVPDGLDQCGATPAGIGVDAIGCPIDSDGDGVTDDLDVCSGTPPGIPVDEAGCSGGADDCIGVVESRGYTVAHYDADMNVLAAPDPDFFDWDLSTNWCVSNDRVYVATVDSLGSVTVDPLVATALELAGFTFQHDPDDEAAYEISNGGTTTGSVTASTDFEVCGNPAQVLLGLVGGKLGEEFIKVAGRIMGRMPNAGDAAAWMDSMVTRLDAGTLDVDAKLLDWLTRATDPKRMGRVADVPIASALWEKVSDVIRSRQSDISLAVTGTDATNSLHEIADTGFRRFLDVYGDGETILVPRRSQAEARAFWNQTVEETALEMADFILGKIEALNMCGTVWRPVVTIYLPQAGESFDDQGQIDASIFDIKGRITVDTRN